MRYLVCACEFTWLSRSSCVDYEWPTTICGTFVINGFISSSSSTSPVYLLDRSSFYTVHFTLFSFLSYSLLLKCNSVQNKKKYFSSVGCIPVSQINSVSFFVYSFPLMIQWKSCTSVRTRYECYYLRCWFIFMGSYRVINIVIVWF